MKCKVNGCIDPAASMSVHCVHHIVYPTIALDSNDEIVIITKPNDTQSMSAKYSKYYKAIPKGATEADTYMVNKMFPVQDNSGCILHARKKLLVPGTRSGGKSFYNDIKEARDTLNRWLELNPE